MSILTLNVSQDPDLKSLYSHSAINYSSTPQRFGQISQKSLNNWELTGIIATIEANRGLSPEDAHKYLQALAGGES